MNDKELFYDYISNRLPCEEAFNVLFYIRYMQDKDQERLKRISSCREVDEHGRLIDD